MTQFNNFPGSTTMSWTTAITELLLQLPASSYDKTSKIILICLSAQVESLMLVRILPAVKLNYQLWNSCRKYSQEDTKI